MPTGSWLLLAGNSWIELRLHDSDLGHVHFQSFAACKFLIGLEQFWHQQIRLRIGATFCQFKSAFLGLLLELSSWLAEMACCLGPLREIVLCVSADDSHAVVCLFW